MHSKTTSKAFNTASNLNYLNKNTIHKINTNDEIKALCKHKRNLTYDKVLENTYSINTTFYNTLMTSPKDELEISENNNDMRFILSKYLIRKVVTDIEQPAVQNDNNANELDKMIMPQ